MEQSLTLQVRLVWSGKNKMTNVWSTWMTYPTATLCKLQMVCFLQKRLRCLWIVLVRTKIVFHHGNLKSAIDLFILDTVVNISIKFSVWYKRNEALWSVYFFNGFKKILPNFESQQKVLRLQWLCPNVFSTLTPTILTF